MKHPNDILPHHEQKHERSCVAWGLELVLKMHGAIQLQDYPLQTGADPCGYGFGQRERQILQGYGVVAREDSFDFPDFVSMMRQEIARGSFPIFTLPSQITIHQSYPVRIDVDYHAWVSTMGQIDLEYLSRSHSHPDILSGLQVAQVFHAFRTQLKPDYRIHCLLHD